MTEAGPELDKLLLDKLLRDIRSCRRCEARLPLGPRPVLQASTTAQIVIAGQAPGTKVHASGKPFDDVSGDRLRAWLGIERSVFYDPAVVNIVPMAFCYPGRLERGGDRPPDPECGATWHKTLFNVLARPKLLIILGRYAIDYHLPELSGQSVSEAVLSWRKRAPDCFVLPHPSPRNQNWVRQRPWFEAELLPVLRSHVNTLVV